MEKTAEKKPVSYDVGGFGSLTTAIREIVNRFPRGDGETQGEILFASLGEDGGAAIYPGSGAVIEEERTSITGKVRQVCRYDFVVGVRLAAPREKTRVSIKDWLDDLGRWLEGQAVEVNGESCKLDSYPTMTDGRRLLGFSRLSASYMDVPTEDHVETWLVALTARYENVYLKNTFWR